MTTPAGNGNGHVLTRDQFAQYVEQRLATLDEVEMIQRADVELIVRVRGGDFRLGLENFYTTYTQNPAQLDAVVATLIRTLQGFNPDRSTQSFADLRERVYPMLKPIALLATVRDRQLPMLVYRPFLADLIVAYVIDEAESVAYINENHLETWQIDEQSLHDQALANLRRRTFDATAYTTAGEGAQRLFIFNSQDGYDATRLLLPELLEQWRAQLPGKLVIGIPNRDFLIAFSDADRTILTNVARQIQFDSAQRAYGLTDQLFTLINGEVREYAWE